MLPHPAFFCLTVPCTTLYCPTSLYPSQPPCLQHYPTLHNPSLPHSNPLPYPYLIQCFPILSSLSHYFSAVQFVALFIFLMICCSSFYKGSETSFTFTLPSAKHDEEKINLLYRLLACSCFYCIWTCSESTMICQLIHLIF